ncbi:MAG: hypothetical protein R3F34_10745 [Planctomycetota bacterium]
MPSLVPLFLFGFAALVPVLFAVLGARRAVAFAYVAGWLFLPVATIDLPLVEYDKAAAIALGCLVGVVLVDLSTLLAFRPGFVDLGIVALCVSPLASSISNELGAYDGFANAVNMTLLWGVPWLLGRLYLGSREGATLLARAVVWGGLAYVPLCAWELRMSPQLHAQLYGYYAHASGFTQVVRFGGWRPTVFMHHGLMVGMFMATAALCALALVRAEPRRRYLARRPSSRPGSSRRRCCASRAGRSGSCSSASVSGGSACARLHGLPTSSSRSP